MTLNEIREDLREIKYYYSNQNLFKDVANKIGGCKVKDLADKYNSAIKNAPARLYFIYANLYVNNLTQEALAYETNVSPEFVQREHTKMLKYLQKQFEVLEGGAENA